MMKNTTEIRFKPVYRYHVFYQDLNFHPTKSPCPQSGAPRYVYTSLIITCLRCKYSVLSESLFILPVLNVGIIPYIRMRVIRLKI